MGLGRFPLGPAHDLVRDSLVSSDPSTPTETRYDHLTARAIEYVRSKGGCVAEADLVGFVFGSSGSPKLWAPLLQRLLADEPSITRQTDGAWSLIGSLSSNGTALLNEFISLDVETTGLKALNHRVIEIAMIQYRDGLETRRFETLINPDREIPKYIVQLTQIDNGMVEDSPRFAEIAREVYEFIDGALIVGHNVGFDIGFLNGEFSRAGLPQLINDRLDTMFLANRIIPSLKRPSLDRIAKELGLQPRKIHRAGIDAEITAEVAGRLAERAKSMGIDSPDRLRQAAKTTAPRPKDDVGRGRALLDRSILADAPKAPGVYIMRDRNEAIIYVGKAKSLRDRLGSYFSQPLGYTRKMDGLLESIGSIETIKTGSELAALLLESQLISRHQPRYNTVMRAAERYPFIRIDLAGKWPRVMLSKSRRDDGARYFGPFKNPRGAKNAVDLINDFFPLRTCTRSFKDARSYGSPCVRLGMKQCLGPCTGQASRDDYVGHVRQAVAFLDGDDDVMFAAIWTELETAAENLNFERARKLRNNLHTLRSIVDAHQIVRKADERPSLVLVQPGPVPLEIELMLIAKGRRWASFFVLPNEHPAELACRIESAWNRLQHEGLKPVTQLSLDETNILGRWLARHDGHPAVLPLPEEGAVDWEIVVRQAMSLGEDELHWVPPAGEDLVVDEAVEFARPPRPVIELIPVDFTAEFGAAAVCD